MEQRFNKPRVFLSHASTDVTFIERMQSDFRKCQIDSWRDQTDIRDGQPWMEAIFEHGIPTCDAILAYFTPAALNSKTFAREVDSAILTKLHDNNVAFLPYVCDSNFRRQIRLDVQSLQCREWNQNNYSELLPSVVSEIWRSYLDRVIVGAVADERVKRLELELQVNKLEKRLAGSIFTAKEETEFAYLRTKLDIPHEMTVEAVEIDGITVGHWRISVSLIQLLRVIHENNRACIATWLIEEEVGKWIKGLLQNEEHSWNELYRFDVELIGLLERYDLTAMRRNDYSIADYSKKMGRFMYWIEYHGIEFDPTLVEFSAVSKIQE